MENNRFKLGLFTACGILLFIVTVTCMGAFDFLKDTGYLATTVRESVQGLNTGSTVKLRGVPIGKVEDITILMDSKDKDIRITMKVDLNKFGKTSENFFSGHPLSRSDFYSIMEQEVREGLRCRIEPDGITGSKYLEIDFFDPEVTGKNEKSQGNGRNLTRKAAMRDGYFFIPSVPSMMSTLKLNMTEILAKIASIDFDGISRQTNELLGHANKILDSNKIDLLISNINTAVNTLQTSMNNINESLPPRRIQELAQEVQLAVQQIRSGVKELQQDVKGADLPGTFSDFRGLSGNVRELSNSADETLQKLNDTVDALTELIQGLQDDPSSLIHGRKSGPAFPLMERKKGK